MHWPENWVSNKNANSCRTIFFKLDGKGNSLLQPAQQILVAPKDTPADPLLLDCATELQAKVVTNDQFRDWAESHPQMKEPGFLVTGAVRGDDAILDEIA